MGERSVAILPESERELALSLAPRKGGPFLLFYSTPSQLVERFRLPSPTFPPPFDLDETLARLVYKMVSFRQGSLERFKIDPHKVERFPDRWGRLWVDDSKATNVDATLKGLAQFADRKIYLILGGQGKGQDFTPLFQTLSQRKVELILIGESAPQLAQLAERFYLPYFLAYTLEKGVDYIHRRLKEGEVALLSPACASKDQFKSYKERGERFKELVTRLR
jgi:UDP-N-acetylmuramoylalanine--D-glutamate ligase